MLVIINFKEGFFYEKDDFRYNVATYSTGGMFTANCFMIVH